MPLPDLTPPLQPPGALARLLTESEFAGHALYLGAVGSGHAWARPEQGVLVLGPPRSGKTATIVVPNVLAAGGPVVAASTKPDLLQITSAARAQRGRCFVFDPSGTVRLPPSAERIGWSPLLAGRTWDGSLLVAEAMVRAARPGTDRGDAVHWSERAGALLAVSFHAGALDERDFGTVISAMDRRDLAALRRPLAEHNAGRALDLLNGLAATDRVSRAVSGRPPPGFWPDIGQTPRSRHDRGNARPRRVSSGNPRPSISAPAATSSDRRLRLSPASCAS